MQFFITRDNHIGCIVFPYREDFLSWLRLANVNLALYKEEPYKEVPVSCIKRLFPGKTWMDGQWTSIPSSSSTVQWY